MAASDENNRGSVREKARLRPTISDEPSSGYAFHDEARVDTLRGGPRVTPSKPAGDMTQPANDTGRSPRAKPTMMGGFAVPIGDESGAVPTRPAEALEPRKPPLSEPPEVGSWPPMPSVPPELEGAADGRQGSAPKRSRSRDDLDTAPTDPPRAAAMGGIWEAVPSVMRSEAPDEVEDEPTLARESISALVSGAAAERSVAEVTAPIDPVGLRMSVTDSSYGDPRLAKLDRIVERGAWEQLTKELDSMEQPSPLLKLLHILSRRELADDKAAVALNAEAIRALAAVLDVPESSPTALLLGKRLLRRHRTVATAPASAGLSAGVLLAGLAVGAGVGWLVTRLFL